ncbi:MAG: hypothetical protein COB98_09565 [Flavobacteriaceae bacterium]|nr:MAG: hypothetical protein COB98_09565 [Flavobacteriaceae bacterium]
MKYIIRIILAIVLGLIGIGFYIKQTDIPEGRFYVGLGVVTLAFILMPLFIYHSYKDKDLTKYTYIVNPEKEDEEEKEDKNEDVKEKKEEE